MTVESILPATGAAGAAGAFFIAGGTLRADAKCYAERPADTDLLAALQRGGFCYVLTSRQMGKSSLMVRAAAQLRQDGAAVVVIDLTAIGQNLEVERWYFCLLSQIGERLGLEDEVEAYWDTHQRKPPLARWTGALREVVLEITAGRVVIFIDEIDYVRSLTFQTDEFFAGIRECFNRRTEDPVMGRLTFCLLGVATPSDLIKDQRLTPFNIGQAIELTDFTPAQAAVFGSGLHPDPAVAEVLIARVLYWTGGHPYLTQKLCAEVVRAGAIRRSSVDEVCERVFLVPHARERDDNLHFVRERVLRCNCDLAALLDLYARLCRRQKVEDDDTNPLVNALRLAGIVRASGRHLRIRNRIYARVFNLRWVRESLPDAERRRQRAAFYRGVRRVAGAAFVAVAFMASMAAYAVSQKQHAQMRAEVARKALAEAESEKQSKARALEEAESQRKVAETQRVDAVSQRKLAEEKAAQLNAAKKQIALNLTRTQDSIVKLLEALAPVLDVKSESREGILQRAKLLYSDEVGGETPEVQRGKASLVKAWALLYLKLGQAGDAVKYARQALEIMEGLARSQPNDLDLTRRRIECHNTLGDALLGDRRAEANVLEEVLKEAIDHYERGLALARETAEEHPGRTEWHHLVISSLNNIGDVQVNLGRPEAARASYLDAKQRLDSLLKSTPGDWSLKEGLAQIYDRLGDLLLGDDKASEATKQFELGFDIRKDRVEASLPGDAGGASSALATSYNKLGKAASWLGDRKLALNQYERSHRMREQLATENPQHSEWQRNLGISCHNIAALLKEREPERAKELYRRRVSIMKGLHERDPLNRDWKGEFCNALNNCADFLMNGDPRNKSGWKEALNCARLAAQLTDFSNPRFLGMYAQAQRLDGQRGEGRATLEKAMKLLPPEPQRTEEQKEIAKDLAVELKASSKEMGTPIRDRRTRR